MASFSFLQQTYFVVQQIPSRLTRVKSFVVSQINWRLSKISPFSVS